MLSIKRILCPGDFSGASHHAVEHALALGRWYGARVIARRGSHQAEERAVSLAGGGRSVENAEAPRLRR